MANTKTPRSDLRAGLFILISIGLIVAVIVGIKGVGTLFAPTDLRRVRFSLKDDLSGLAVGDDVRLGGYKVGAIKAITVDLPADGQDSTILVSFTMPKKYALHKDAHLFIQSGITGSSNLNIDSLGAGEVLADGGELNGHPSSITQLLSDLGDTAPQIKGIVTDFRTNTMPKVNEDAAKASATLTSIRTAGESITNLLGDTVPPDLRKTIANLSSITGTTKEKLPEILDHANHVMVSAGTAIDKAQGTMEDIRATAANAKDVTAGARDLITGNRGKFDNIIAGLKASSDNLKGATAEVRRSPWRLLYHPGPGELDNLELYDAARQFADGANNVNDASTALKDALSNPNVDKAQVARLIKKLDESFTNFNTVEQKLWKTVKPE